MGSDAQKDSPQADPVAKKNLYWTRLGVIVAICGIIVMIVIAAVTNPSSDHTQEPSRSSEPTTIATTAISTGGEHPTGAPPAAPSDLSSTPSTGCFQNDSPVPCSSHHDKEVFQPGEGLSCCQRRQDQALKGGRQGEHQLLGREDHRRPLRYSTPVDQKHPTNPSGGYEHGIRDAGESIPD